MKIRLISSGAWYSPGSEGNYYLDDEIQWGIDNLIDELESTPNLGNLGKVLMQGNSSVSMYQELLN